MRWPATPDEIRAAGYEYDQASQCKACSRRIHWAWTPNRKRMPLDRLSDGRLQPHWATCEYAERFKPKPDPRQKSLFGETPATGSRYPR